MKSPRNQPASVSPARAAAFDILMRVESESSYAADLLHSATYSRMSAADHGLTTELVMGVLRWRSSLDSQITGQSGRSLKKLDLEVLIALRIGAYQLGWLTRIPARAAINESVELIKRARKRSAVPFANAVLRKISQLVPASAPSSDAQSPADLANTTAHPLWLVERWAERYGLDTAQQICEYNQSVPQTTIRLNAANREEATEIEEQLHNEGIELTPGAFLSTARRVLKGDVTRSACFRSGECAIQDEASQLVATLVGHGDRILDCCAAPGGKTAVIAQNNPESEILAMDLRPHRVRVLRKLLGLADQQKSHSSRVSVLVADARLLPLSAKFDRILADVPCSGTGTLARNPEIKWRLTAKDLHDLHSRQLAILRSAATQLNAGGRVIYSTCSLEKEENEDVIEAALKHDSSLRLIDSNTVLEELKQECRLVWPDLASLTRGPYLRTLPGKHPCEGFFAAIIEKI